MQRNTPQVLLTVAVMAFLPGTLARADALAKLKPDKLEAVHQAVKALRAEWHKLPRRGPYQEYRANLHVHSALSHDSRGTLAEIVAAAKAAGTSVLMFTEHPSDKYDYFKDGHRGFKDGVLLIPGAEVNGFLVFPTKSPHPSPPPTLGEGRVGGSPQEFCHLVRRQGGLVFLSHLEERMNWEIRDLTGTEIYNIHADFKDEKNLIAALRNPLWLLKTAELFRKYPQEAFSALQDYPADYLKRWDQLCELAPHTGVAANDSHQNVGLVVRLGEGDKARYQDALGKRLFDLDGGFLPTFPAMRKDKKVGDTLFDIRLDPYENSLRHVGTHLLLTKLSEKSVWEALEAGRAFVAFDWLADSTGFDFAGLSPSRRYEMGERLALEEGLKLQGQAPVQSHWRLIRNAKVISESTGRSLDIRVLEPGNYRVEVWLDVAGEEMIWILSNPLYIRKGTESR